MAGLRTLSPHGVTMLEKLLPAVEMASMALTGLNQGKADIEAVVLKLRDAYPEAGELTKIELVLNVFWVFSEDASAAQAILSDERYTSLRDVALGSLDISKQISKAIRAEFLKRIYDLDATGCIMSAVESMASSGAEGATAALGLLKSNPKFDIEGDSVWTMTFNTSDSEAAAGAELLMAAQRLQAVVVSVDELVGLWSAGYRSALQIIKASEADFVSQMADQGIEATDAEGIQSAATAVKARNEHLLMLSAHSTLSEQINVPVLRAATNGVSLQPAGPAPPISIIAPALTSTQVAATTQSSPGAPINPNTPTARSSPGVEPINLDTLFGNALSVACNECCSVTSPAAYFVDLMQFLKVINIPTSQYGNVLGALTARRPDLLNLQLSCENSDVALPYIDLSNEVLDACVVHQSQLDLKTSTSADPVLPAFNVSPNDQSASLIEAPENVSISATGALYNTISLNLPYDYETDRMKQSLGQLGVAWTKLLEIFQDLSDAPTKLPREQRQIAMDRSVVAAYLNICELDYAYMTTQRFWPAAGSSGVPDERQVWGYIDISAQVAIGVKELSACAGVSVDDLIGLLDTAYINPQKANLSQVEVDFLELIATLGATAVNYLESQQVKMFLQTRSLSPDQFPNFLARVRSTVVANVSSSNSGGLDLNNMTLTLLLGGWLSPVQRRKLWTVFKLSKSMGWTLTQTSKALYLSTMVAEKEESTPEGAVLIQLAYLPRLCELLDLTIDDVVGIWVKFIGTATGSDYSSVFLRPELVKGGGAHYIFCPDASGKLLFEDAIQTIGMLAHETEIAAAFRCTVTDMKILIGALSTTLPKSILVNTAEAPLAMTLSNLSTLYSWNALRKAVRMDSPSFSKFISIFPTCLRNFRSAFEALRDWQRLEGLGAGLDAVHGALRQELSPLQGLETASAKGMHMVFALRRTWEDLQTRLPNVSVDRAVTDEDVRTAALLLYDAATVESIVAFLNGSYVYFDATITSTPPAFMHGEPWPFSSKITYETLGDSFHLRIVGLLSGREAAAAVAAVKDSSEAETLALWTDAINMATSAPDSATGPGSQLFNTLAPQAPGAQKPPSALRDALLGPDDSKATGAAAPGDAGPSAADEKRRQYLTYFTAFARQYLIHKALNDALQSYLGSLSPLSLEFLLHNIRLGGADALPGEVSLGTIAQKLAEAISPDVRLVGNPPVLASEAAADSHDNLKVLQTMFLDVASADTYTFFLPADRLRRASVSIAGTKLVFSNDGSSQPMPLQAQIYPIVGTRATIQMLEWKRKLDMKATLPPSSILTSDEVVRSLAPALGTLSSLSDLIVAFALDTDELVYLTTTLLGGVRFYDQDVGTSLTISGINDLASYCEARTRLGSLSTKSKSLLDLLKWASDPTHDGFPGTDDVAMKLAELYGWDSGVCAVLLSANGHSEQTISSDFVQQMLLLLEQLTVIGKLGAMGKVASVQALLELAVPVAYTAADNRAVDPSKLPQPVDPDRRDATVSSIFVLAAAKASAEQRQKMNNRLRERRRDALVSYLTQCTYFRNKDIADAEALFEHLLIDSQINSVLLTSRLKQAISTVQLYVQRCLLGLEAIHGVPSDAIDAKSWEWMQKYTLWQANREVFLYPENWLDPSLRPLKSEQYQKFESRLTASDTTQDGLGPAITDYVTSVADIGNLEPVALYWDTPDKSGSVDIGRPSQRAPTMLHIFARTRHKPYVFYYRTRDFQSTRYFTPWEKVDVDIPVYEADPSGQPLATPGVYMIVYRMNKRLLMILPQFRVLTTPKKSTAVSAGSDGDYKLNSSAASKAWTLQFAVSEYINGKWSAKQLFNDVIPSTPRTAQLTRDPVFGEYALQAEPLQSTSHDGCYGAFLSDTKPAAIDKYRFWPYRATGDDDDTLRIDVTWHCPCKQPLAKPANYGHRCLVAQVVFRCGRLQPLETRDATLEGDEYSDAASNAPALSQREVWNTVFSKAVAQYGVPGLANGLAAHPGYIDPGGSAVQFHGRGALFSFQDQRDWTDSSPLVYITEPKATKLGLTSALNMETRLAGPWDAQHNKPLRIPLVHAQSADLASMAAMGPGAVFEYLHSLDPQHFLTFTDDGDVDFCDDATLAFGPGAMEMMAPYSQYNAELGLHMPMAMMARFAADQQFDAALAAARLIFDPLDKGIETERCWKWPPFRTLNVVNEVQNLLASTNSSGASLGSVLFDWRQNPFSPYAVARSRPSTYMKWVVMKYIEVLVAYGDSYFRQNTLESIPYALGLYIQASKLFGPAPQTIRDPGTKRTATYASLASRLDAFSDALVDMEVQFPFVVRSLAETQPLAVPSGAAATMATNTILSATTRYFCLPANPRLAQLRGLIDDRLFKIRNSLDINGYAQVLPLFDPPLDPGALVSAVAGGQKTSQLSSVAGTTLPNFRFPHLLGKALELAGELKQLSAAFLSAKQNGDAERMAAMRAQQDTVINAAVMQLKKAQLDEATKSLDALRESRRGPVMRLRHYLALIGEPGSRVPGPDADFSEIDAQIQAPTGDSLRMSPLEKLEMDGHDEAAGLNITASSFSLMASLMALIPDTEENIMPFGGGVTIKAGTGMAVQFLNALSGVNRFLAEAASIQGLKAGRSAQMVRQLQERRLQANVAGREITLIDKQMAAQQARIAAAAADMATQKTAMDHAAMTLEYLRTKYTSAQLFDWMEARVRASFYAMYTLAYDMAKRAEMAFAFERGLDQSTSFVGAGAWDAAYDGLLCGDALALGLRKLEAAYVENRGYDYEISRHVSLRALAPLALLTLRATGTVDFALPELLFDLDFPGHYRRRIRSISLSIPCVVGPYTSVSATLRLLAHRYRYTASGAPTGPTYPEAPGGADARFRTSLVPVAAMAAGTAQADAGVFDLAFRDERYLPFEGAGAVSRWRLELPPPPVRAFDYDAIADVLLHVRYTAAEGGGGLRAAAAEAARAALARVGGGGGEGPLVALLDLKNDFPSEWHRFAAGTSVAAGKRTLALTNLVARLPFYARGPKVAVAAQAALVPGVPAGCEAALRCGGAAPVAFVDDLAPETEGPPRYKLQEDVAVSFDEDWVLELGRTDGEHGGDGGDGIGVLERMWLVVYYSLKV